MSSPRGLANHSLYLARIQLAAWSAELEREIIPAATLAQAFAPAACDHLKRAYGWFLLTLSGHSDTSIAPPRCCSELPEIATGKALPAEIKEFAQLEQAGWLAELLSFQITAPSQHRPVPGHRGNLDSADIRLPVGCGGYRVCQPVGCAYGAHEQLAGRILEGRMRASAGRITYPLI